MKSYKVKTKKEYLEIAKLILSKRSKEELSQKQLKEFIVYDCEDFGFFADAETQDEANLTAKSLNASWSC
jgi:hypothetical protein